MKVNQNISARLLRATSSFAACLSLGGVLLIAGSTACAQDTMKQEGMKQEGMKQEGMAQEKKVDKRKLTTIQTASVDVGATKKAVEVRYLNLPWGKATFGYIENGIDPRNNNYYAKRTWPIAHLHLAAPAEFHGQMLAPGNYAMIITPKNAETKSGLKLAFASFKPAEANGTFLVPGNVFVETPKDAAVVAEKEVAFAEGAPMVDELHIWTGAEGKTVSIKINYGDRTLTEKLTLK
ncbi:MAG: hypothetical protein ACR2G4_16125 [Pyrinomonadaceae bacterium]